jgi:microcin C transport system permease protein
MRIIERYIKNPMTWKRLVRFKEMKRAYVSFWILLILYVVSLGSELICNSVPLYVGFQGKSYFPVFKFYPEDIFLKNGKQTRTDYQRMRRSPPFLADKENFMIWPPFVYGPYQSIDPTQIAVSDTIRVRFDPMPIVATINIRNDYTIARSYRLSAFFGQSDDQLPGRSVTDFMALPADIKQAIRDRFANRDAGPIFAEVRLRDSGRAVVNLSTFRRRRRPPQTVRLLLREYHVNEASAKPELNQIIFDRQLERVEGPGSSAGESVWRKMSASDQGKVLELVSHRYFGPVDQLMIEVDGRNYTVRFEKEDVRFPFPPTRGHPLGIDDAGRDVLARILYGLRTSMSFGIILVICSMTIGIVAGALQGYYGGILDITGQRFIEIWSALPFLYVMILMGSIYGRSFSLLLFCYGLFNWIGISYYIRAEFLRLRKQPFVEAAKAMGVPAYKLIFKHILPNGLIPVITFFPFSLVGAIGALAALDYLGFGLPPPTPSWGELLYQAQQYRWAWWLILYPSLALFLVMLLGVFVGEGIRNAYDPKRYARLE